MGHSSFRRGALLAAFLALLAGCAPAPVPVPSSAAPYPKQYTCAQQAQAAAEYRELPENSRLAVLLSDYHDLRRELWAMHGMAEPRCQ